MLNNILVNILSQFILQEKNISKISASFNNKFKQISVNKIFEVAFVPVDVTNKMVDSVAQHLSGETAPGRTDSVIL